MDWAYILDLLREIAVCLILTLYYIAEAIVFAFVPSSWRWKNVAGENVLITGSGSGMGRLMAYRFALLKCNLVLWDIQEGPNEETAAHCRRLGAKVHTYVCDLSSRDSIYATAEKVKKEVGNIDILVNNAGIVTGKKFLSCRDELIQKTMDVNVSAHFWTVKAFLPSMMTRNHGHVVSIASSAGLSGVTGLADYCASKHAAVGFNDSLMFELFAMGKTGVHTTVVCPFYINTGMFEGVRTRFPLILPIVEPEYAVDRIMNAVLTNKSELYIPYSIYLFIALKGLLPGKVQLIVSNLFGINNCMDDFKGRQKQD